MSKAQALHRLRQTARRRENLIRQSRAATDDLGERCRQARDAGVPIAQIAREAGLSRQGVYDLLAGRPS
jgi:hypothetical protein